MTDNATLAKRIADLERQLSHSKHTSELLLEENKQLLVNLSLKSDLLESSMLSEATAKQYAEEVDKQNAALAAQVEALKLSDSELHTLVEDLIDHLRYNKRESTDVLETYWDRLSAIQTTQISPQQHLAVIRAEAGRAGFVAGFKRRTALGPLRKMWSEEEIIEIYNQYAGKIRQEGK